MLDNYKGNDEILPTAQAALDKISPPKKPRENNIAQPDSTQNSKPDTTQNNRLIKDEEENKHMKLKYTYTLFTLIMVLYFVPVNAQKSTKSKKTTTKTTTKKTRENCQLRRLQNRAQKRQTLNQLATRQQNRLQLILQKEVAAQTALTQPMAVVFQKRS